MSPTTAGLGSADRRLRIGAAYYWEYLREDRLDTDLDMMRDAGFRVIRVGESVWSTWEPREGQYNTQWLRPILDGAHQRGIDVIVGTPTYAIPAWLATAHPDVLAEDATGRRVPYGGRQNADLTHPYYLDRAARVLDEVVRKYRDHPAVIGWQVDNEPGAYLLHNDRVFQGFVDRLRARFGTVESLNAEWGLTYWSHRLTDFDELWRPDGNTNPSYNLAWRSYQDDIVTNFIDWQREKVRSIARADQFITTCIASNQPGADGYALGQSLDRTAVNIYTATQDGLEAPRATSRQGSPWWDTGERGAWALARSADTARGYRNEPFLVTETNATSTGLSEINNAPYPGQWILIAMTMIMRGATMIEYWHWHSLPYGAETYWGGILDHRMRPGRCYRELAELAHLVTRFENDLSGLVPDEDVLIVTSLSSRHALAFQPPLLTPQGEAADRSSYERIDGAFYRAFNAAGAQAGVRDIRDLVADDAPLPPIVVAAALYAASDEQLDALLSYAKRGGHLILGPRTGYADDEGRARTTWPDLINAAGIDFDESNNLAEPVVVYDNADRRVGFATAWADGLRTTADDVRSIARYRHPFFELFSAATTRVVGAGRISYVGTLPDQTFGSWLASEALAERAVSADWVLAASVRLSSALNDTGDRVFLLANWSSAAADITTPGIQLIDVSGDLIVLERTPLTIPAWGHRLLIHRAPVPRVDKASLFAEQRKDKQHAHEDY